MNKRITTFITTIVLGLVLHTAVARKFDKSKEETALRLVVANYKTPGTATMRRALRNSTIPTQAGVNWFGAYSKGQQDIQEHYQTVHSTYFKTSHYYTRSIEDATFVKPDVAIMHVRTGLTGDERYPGQTFEFRRTLVLTKRDGVWRILAGQNAKLNEGIK